jgi:hypothetical protein
LVLIGIAAVVAGCRATRSRGAGPGPPEPTLRYSGGLSGRAFGVRLWEARGRVHAATFGTDRRATRDSSVLRASLRALTALAAAPLDTAAQDSLRIDGRRMAWLCGDGIRATVSVRGPSGVTSVGDGRCRKSEAEVRFRRAADSLYARLTVVLAR